MDSIERNLLITIQYDGTAYHGFQVQVNAISVCEVFQNAVEGVFGERLDIKGCSRTDAGVHAKDYKLSMKVKNEIPCERLLLAINRLLPKDIAVTEIFEVPLSFHARYNAKGKQYTYYINNSGVRDVFSPTLFYHYPRQIDERLLEKEAQDLVGKHDFLAFCSNPKSKEDTIRTIKRISVVRSGAIVEIIVEGDGFLRNMVRIIVGTLIGICEGKIEQGELKSILESRNRQKAGKTAPGHGLYLTKVYYPDELGVDYEDTH